MDLKQFISGTDYLTVEKLSNSTGFIFNLNRNDILSTAEPNCIKSNTWIIASMVIYLPVSAAAISQQVKHWASFYNFGGTRYR